MVEIEWFIGCDNSDVIIGLYWYDTFLWSIKNVKLNNAEKKPKKKKWVSRFWTRDSLMTGSDADH